MGAKIFMTTAKTDELRDDDGLMQKIIRKTNDMLEDTELNAVTGGKCCCNGKHFASVTLQP
jgi:hypothetical protein